MVAAHLDRLGPVPSQNLTNAQLRDIEAGVYVVDTRLLDVHLNDDMPRAANQIASLIESRGVVEATEKFQSQLSEVIS